MNVSTGRVEADAADTPPDVQPQAGALFVLLGVVGVDPSHGESPAPGSRDSF